MFNIVILGLIISIIFYELTEISPGGIVVPGLLMLYMHRIDWMIYTVIIAILTYFLVKWLSSYFLIFGKRRFVLMIIFSLVINLILSFVIDWIPFAMMNLSIVGYTVAGIIANDIERQGIKRTIPALIIVLSVTEVIFLLLQQLGV